MGQLLGLVIRLLGSAEPLVCYNIQRMDHRIHLNKRMNSKNWNVQLAGGRDLCLCSTNPDATAKVRVRYEQKDTFGNTRIYPQAPA